MSPDSRPFKNSNLFSNHYLEKLVKDSPEWRQEAGLAEAFAKIMEQEQIPLDAVLNYDLPIEKVVARLSGRRTCPGCKAVFHVTGRPPRVEGICDHCGTKLQQREDDRPEAVRVRMDVYEKSTRPLTDFYEQRGLLVTIEAEGTPEEIYQRTLAALGSAPGGKQRRPERTNAD